MSAMNLLPLGLPARSPVPSSNWRILPAADLMGAQYSSRSSLFHQARMRLVGHAFCLPGSGPSRRCAIAVTSAPWLLFMLITA